MFLGKSDKSFASRPATIQQTVVGLRDSDNALNVKPENRNIVFNDNATMTTWQHVVTLHRIVTQGSSARLSRPCLRVLWQDCHDPVFRFYGRIVMTQSSGSLAGLSWPSLRVLWQDCHDPVFGFSDRIVMTQSSGSLAGLSWLYI